jgi:hypothetical protein
MRVCARAWRACMFDLAREGQGKKDTWLHGALQPQRCATDCCARCTAGGADLAGELDHRIVAGERTSNHRLGAQEQRLPVGTSISNTGTDINRNKRPNNPEKDAADCAAGNRSAPTLNPYRLCCTYRHNEPHPRHELEQLLRRILRLGRLRRRDSGEPGPAADMAGVSPFPAQLPRRCDSGRARLVGAQVHAHRRCPGVRQSVPGRACVCPTSLRPGADVGLSRGQTWHVTCRTSGPRRR